MGGLGEQLAQKILRKLGREKASTKAAVIDEMWEGVEQAVEALPLAWDKVRLYQDGLPFCGREQDIVADLARAGSRNHQLLLRLTDKGAMLMGTESVDLLMQEYELIRQSLERGEPSRFGMTESAHGGGDALLKLRDRYIARRINETLEPGETGVLFLGMLHSLAGLLDDDIAVKFPLHRPLDGYEEQYRGTP